MMSFNQATSEFNTTFSMNTETIAQTSQAAQCDQFSSQANQTSDFHKFICQISATDASSTKTSCQSSSIGSTGPVKKKWSRFVEAQSNMSAENVSVPTSDEEGSQEDCAESMRRMRMRAERRREDDEQEVLLNKRIDFACDQNQDKETQEFERGFCDPQPSKLPPQYPSPRPYYLHPHLGGHAPHLPGGYACGLAQLSTSTLLGQTGQLQDRDLQDRDLLLRDPLRVSLLHNQLEREQPGYEHPQQPQHQQQPQQQQSCEERREQEHFIRESEGSSLINVFTSPKGTQLNNRNLNPPNNNTNCSQLTTNNSGSQNCSQINESQEESRFSCGQAAPAQAAGGAGTWGGVGSGSLSSGSCSCSQTSSCSQWCFFKRTTTTTTTTLTTTTTAMSTEGAVVGDVASSVVGADAQTSSMNQESTEVKETSETKENKCSSSCKQILSDVPSLDDSAARYAQRHGGRYIQLKVRFHDKFSFKCALEHKIQLSSEEINQYKWCAKCDDLYKCAQRYAKKKEGTLLDEKISPMINFKCSRGHTFQLKPAEKLTKWCSTCSQSSNINFGTSIPEGISWHYIGATQRNSNDLLFKSFQAAFEKQNQNQDLLEILNNIELATTYAEIKKLAIIYLNKYIKENTSSSLSESFLRENMEQFIWVYRVILMPEALLKHLLFQFGEKQAKNNYRRLCILTHPDKNCHPLAGKAFQKLLCAFSMN